jgi:ABC-2 type transport system permease protein
MTALLRSELLKVRTIRTHLWLTLATVALVVIASISVSASSGAIKSASDDRSVAQIAAIALVFSLIAGIIVMAGEVTHGTVTQSLLATPVRERLVLAKVGIAALIALGLALLAELLVLAITVPGASLHFHNARAVFLGILIAAPLAAALGVGLGAVVRSQGSGVAFSLVWLLIGEHIVLLIDESASRYSPGRAFAALASGTRSGGHEVLGMGGGAAASLVWTALFLVVGLFVFLGREHLFDPIRQARLDRLWPLTSSSFTVRGSTTSRTSPSGSLGTS